MKHTGNILKSHKYHSTRASGQNETHWLWHELSAFHARSFQMFLVAILPSLVTFYIGDEAEGKENRFHKIILNPDQ